MKNFCKDLKEHTQMLPLTDEENVLLKNKDFVKYVKKNLVLAMKSIEKFETTVITLVNIGTLLIR